MREGAHDYHYEREDWGGSRRRGSGSLREVPSYGGSAGFSKSERDRTRRWRSLGVLAGGVAHDFNNLLVGIMGNSSLMISTCCPHRVP